MSKPVIEVQILGLAAASGGCAVFLGNEEKVFVIYVEQSVGLAIAMFKQGTQKERPLTHDLLANILRALEAKIERVIISDALFRCRFGASTGSSGSRPFRFVQRNRDV
jgi:bifunctional DNase/RNase